MISKKGDLKNNPTALPWRFLLVVLCGFAAAWISAGSIGLLGHPLRKILTHLVLGIIVFSLPLSSKRWYDVTWRALGILLAVLMTTSSFQPINILAVAALLACLGIGLSEPLQSKNAILLTSASVGVFGIYRLAYRSIPAVCLAVDRVSKFLGVVAGSISGKPLWVGVTFGGLDFLVLVFAFFGCWLIYSRSIRFRSILYVILAIFAGHLIYLVILSIGTVGMQKLPEGSSTGIVFRYLGIFSLWNFPQLAGYIHLAIAGIVIRRLSWPQKQNSFRLGNLNPRWTAISLAVAGVVSALVLAVLTSLYTPVGSLKGCKIVVYEHGFLNWLKPRHDDYGRLSIGMYGMFTAHIESLGGRCVISPDLSESDLADAHLLVLLYPNEPWPAGMLDRIWQFVEDGGSLLVMGEHTIKEPDGGNRFNDVLAPTNMRVRFDSATFAIGGWLHSYQSLSHPAFIGINDDRNQYGVVIGASVESRWPSRPLLIGRWGWADPGDETSGRAMMGNDAYDEGEKLGDLVLAAEQRYGKGRIIAFGDTSSLTNGILVDSHPFAYRLFSYLANKRGDYQPAWRQLAALLFALFLSLLLAYLPGREKALTVVCLAVVLTVCLSRSSRTIDLLPDGRLKQPNNLAYIDSTHLPISSEESWREDGTMGLTMTLMRNGYLALSLPEFTREHLERAGLLVLVSPRRSFTRNERDMIYDFVNKGGLLICMAGYEDCGPIRPLLSDFGFGIGLPGFDPEGTPREPQPFGHFKSPYLNTGKYLCYVRFYAAWPIFCKDPEAEIMAYGRGEVPVMIRRDVGHGKIVVIGDTGFAMNKNLEHQDGSLFEGMHENASFWRWFITVLRDEPMWVPPNENPGR